MKRRKHNARGLMADAAFIAAISLVNRCLKPEKSEMVNRDVEEKSLSRKLTLVSLAYHAIGIFYNE
jgi:hypothetical protein